jgi:hypothetical protein
MRIALGAAVVVRLWWCAGGDRIQYFAYGTTPGKEASFVTDFCSSGQSL